MDLLALIRDACVSDTIRVRDSADGLSLIFEGVREQSADIGGGDIVRSLRFLKTTPTRLRSANKKHTEPYDLMSVWFFINDPTSKTAESLIREHVPYVNRCSKIPCKPLMIMDKRKVLPYLRSVDDTATKKALNALSAQIDETLPLATPLELSERDTVMLTTHGSDSIGGGADDEEKVFEPDGKSVDEGVLAAALKAANYTLSIKDVAILRARMIVAGSVSSGLSSDSTAIGASETSADPFNLISVEPLLSAEDGDEEKRSTPKITIGAGCRRAHEAINTKAAQALDIFGAELRPANRASILRSQTGASLQNLLNGNADSTSSSSARLARCLDVFSSAMEENSTVGDGRNKKRRQNLSSDQPRSKARRPSSVMRTANSLGTPIIVVPSSVSSLLTVHNVEEFLKSGRFVSTRESKDRKVTSIPKDGLRLSIKLPGYDTEREFRFVDNPLMQLRRKKKKRSPRRMVKNCCGCG